MACIKIATILIAFHVCIPNSVATIGENMVIIGNDSKILTPCESSLESFAEKASLFLMCAVRYSRPVMFCENCVKEYVHFTTIYDFIVQLDDVTSSGKKCRDVLMHSDRIQVVVKTHKFVTDIWKLSNCEKCFSYAREKNGTVEYEISNSTKSFVDQYNITMDCMLKYAEGYSDDDRRLELASGSNKTYNHTACHECAPQYKHLNRLYESLHDGDGAMDAVSICMDIVDAMNFTRQVWSKDFRCLHARRDYFYVLSTTLFVAFLPVVFYISSRLHSDTQEINVRHQQRLDASVSANFNPDSLAGRHGGRGGQFPSVSSAASDSSSNGNNLQQLPIDNTVGESVSPTQTQGASTSQPS